MLYVYDKAVAKLIEEAPGFGPLWVKALRDAEEEFAKSERGILAFTKNLLGLRSSKNLNSYVAEDVEIENPNNDNENVESNNINSSQKPL
jgi:hypothetical protein